MSGDALLVASSIGLLVGTAFYHSYPKRHPAKPSDKFWTSVLAGATAFGGLAPPLTGPGLCFCALGLGYLHYHRLQQLEDK